MKRKKGGGRKIVNGKGREKRRKKMEERGGGGESEMGEETRISGMIDKESEVHHRTLLVQMQTLVSSAVSRTIFCCSSVSAC